MRLFQFDHGSMGRFRAIRCLPISKPGIASRVPPHESRLQEERRAAMKSASVRTERNAGRPSSMSLITML